MLIILKKNSLTVIEPLKVACTAVLLWVTFLTAEAFVEAILIDSLIPTH